MLKTIKQCGLLQKGNQIITFKESCFRYLPLCGIKMERKTEDNIDMQ